MYIKYFGLNKLPFENVPDPLFFFDEGDYHRIRERITESLRSGRGLIVVSGPIGSGKTTLSQMIKSDLSNDIKLIWMAEPPGTSIDLFLFIAQELGLNPATSERVFLLRDIKDALLRMTSGGGKCLLIIDESHLMEDDVLNGIRLLNNLEEGSSKLIQILLLGQEEFITTINKPEMEPFKQRIASLEILGKMNGDRIREYILHRIHVAGGSSSIITDTGWEGMVLAFDSGGAPRVINSLCDRALHAAFERNKSAVDVHDVYEATKTMGIGKKVFHYIVALNTMEKKKQEHVKDEIDATQRTETPVNQPVHASVRKSDSFEIEKRTKPAGIFQPAKPFKPLKIPEISFTRDSGDLKALKKPLLFLLSSLAALILSLFFYCWRSGSHDLMSCLLELLGL